MKPIIGIVGRFETNKKDKTIIGTFDLYRRAIIYYGGIPFTILPPQVIDYQKTKGEDIGHLTSIDKEILDAQIKMCDGIIMPGGDIRYDYDNYICKQVNLNSIPLLGICMGMQIMCNYINHNKNLKNDNDRHKKPEENNVHEVFIEQESNLFNIIKQEKIMVNSNHNYHVSNSGEYKIAAYSDDGLIEAIEKEGFFNYGLQWHPEKNYQNDVSKNIFNAFIEAAKSKKI